MDKVRIITACAVIATTLKETPGMACPLGPMYAALNSRNVTFPEYQTALNILRNMGLCRTTAETATYTTPAPGSKGEQFITECENLLQKGREDRAARKDAANAN